MLVPFGENFIDVEKNILRENKQNWDFHHGGSSAIAAKANFEKVRTLPRQCEHAEDDDTIKNYGYLGFFYVMHGKGQGS
jgi:hypothetical protein